MVLIKLSSLYVATVKSSINIVFIRQPVHRSLLGLCIVTSYVLALIMILCSVAVNNAFVDDGIGAI